MMGMNSTKTLTFYCRTVAIWRRAVKLIIAADKTQDISLSIS